MKIVIPDDYQDVVRTLDCFQKLAGHEVRIYTDTVKTIDALEERFADADALVLIRERTHITEELLARLPKLKLIAQTGRGVAHIDMAACARRGVTVTTGGGSPYATAELTWGLILAALRRIPQEAARLRSGLWQGSIGVGLRGRTLGVFGYGSIGAVVAGYGRAFGMQVLVWGREGSLTRARADGFAVAADKAELFAQSDVLSLHIKLSAETRDIVTAADLALMKPTALFVNTSRAGLIAAGALEAALRAGRPGLAAVDVYEEEPVLDAAHPLLALDNALCTPHLGYVERDNYETYFGEAFEQVAAFAAKSTVLNSPKVLASTIVR
ncbi:MAG: glyoxylate reductase [Chloroflexota bacterium]|jgi:D-3-phosphoglycerate dehydrogenase|nr:D-2-hydroxyacid dehydrogenase family protein [Caldilinea sp.]GIK73674.1 MAG: glyoxylate reductase [Chloroflexota bacterium]